MANILVLIAIALYYKGMLTVKRKAYHLSEIYPQDNPCRTIVERHDPEHLLEIAAFYYMEPKIYRNNTGYTSINNRETLVCFCESYEHNRTKWNNPGWDLYDNIKFTYEGKDYN